VASEPVVVNAGRTRAQCRSRQLPGPCRGQIGRAWLSRPGYRRQRRRGRARQAFPERHVICRQHAETGETQPEQPQEKDDPYRTPSTSQSESAPTRWVGKDGTASRPSRAWVLLG
jgi:hypothetical protein